MATRLQQSIENDIHPDQTNIANYSNIQTLLNIISYSISKKLSVLLCLIDICKAFASLEIPYFTELLTGMNFSPNFLVAVTVIYLQPKARIKVNGLSSVLFPLAHGTRQGDPLSPLLFALAMESLATIIWQHPSIKGIKVGGKEFKLSLYADNLVIYLDNDFTTLPISLTILQEFRNVSGLCINLAKSEIFPIHIDQDVKNLIHSLFGLKWVSSTWRYLGTEVPTIFKNLFFSNFAMMFQQV